MTYSPDDVGSILTEDPETFRGGNKVVVDRVEVETDKAIGLPRNDSDDDLIWLPKSQIHAEEMIDEAVRVFIPDWLLEAEEDNLAHLELRE